MAGYVKVRNYRDMEVAIAERAPFAYRNRAGIVTGNTYTVLHYGTVIATFRDGILDTFNGTYYSNTTSGVQGRILRTVETEHARAVIDALNVSDERRKALHRMIY